MKGLIIDNSSPEPFAALEVSSGMTLGDVVLNCLGGNCEIVHLNTWRHLQRTYQGKRASGYELAVVSIENNSETGLSEVEYTLNLEVDIYPKSNYIKQDHLLIEKLKRYSAFKEGFYFHGGNFRPFSDEDKILFSK